MPRWGSVCDQGPCCLDHRSDQGECDWTAPAGGTSTDKGHLDEHRALEGVHGVTLVGTNLPPHTKHPHWQHSTCGMVV